MESGCIEGGGIVGEDARCILGVAGLARARGAGSLLVAQGKECAFTWTWVVLKTVDVAVV